LLISPNAEVFGEIVHDLPLVQRWESKQSYENDPLEMDTVIKISLRVSSFEMQAKQNQRENDASCPQKQLRLLEH
jgi:hypothetical protein